MGFNGWSRWIERLIVRDRRAVWQLLFVVLALLALGFCMALLEIEL